jgi:cell division protein FtsZ
MGALTVGVVTTPFKVEGDEKMTIAENGIKKLREMVDTLIIIPNESLFNLIDRKMSFNQMLKGADEILCQAVRGISDLITKPGLINTDFADVEATMKGQGDAHLGIGMGSGDNRAIDAANGAIDNPILEDISIEGATRLLVNISGPENIPAAEVREILNTIRAKVGPDARLKFGITFDPDLEENVKVTVVATGFQNKSAALVHDGISSGKKESAPIDFINHQQYKALTGQHDKRHGDNYYGIIKNRNDHENLDIPTAVRKYNSETDDSQIINSYHRKEA